ncbi:MAG: hypothetical protein JW725_01535 [Candidatus Babeliaceae bacterium]|nr:hypothetical protein [Candidatus Babeliaceae bacterium]
MKLFGTDGIRRICDDHFFSEENLIRFGTAFITWIKNITPDTHLSIGIISDTRASCVPIKRFLIKGLGRAGATIFDGGILPTPAAYILQKEFSCPFVFVISASHNPASDNGIKIIGPHGKLTQNQESSFEQHFSSFLLTQTKPLSSRTIDCAQKTRTAYINSLISRFSYPILTNKTIILDCAHGATTEIAPLIFKKLGAFVNTIGTSPDGFNINKNCGSLHPENIQRTVLGKPGSFGCAFDGDGDRVIVCTPNGQILDGDDLLWVLSHNPAYSTTPTIIGTVMTNGGLEHALWKNKKKLIRTQVGDKHISEALTKNKLILGGEPNGHLILKDSPTHGDAIFAALRTFETVSNEQVSLFKKHPEEQRSIHISRRPDLNGEPYATLIAATQEEIVPGRIIVRYSGTEPLLRILVEAATKEIAQYHADTLAKNLYNLISKE